MGRLPATFFQGDVAPRREGAEPLEPPAGPAHFDLLDRSRLAQAEQEARIGGGKVARSSRPDLAARAPARGHGHARADRIAIAGGPHQLDADPVPPVAAVVAEEAWRLAGAQEKDVGVAVVVVVA